MLPSKTIPHGKSHKCQLKPKTAKMTTAIMVPPQKKAKIASCTKVEVIEDRDGDSPCAGHGSITTAGRNTTISSASSFQMSYPVPVKVRSIF